MNKEEIRNIIHDFFGRLKKLHREIEKDPETISIKPYRIQIKKLRAFLRLNALETKDPKHLKLPKPIRKQYKSGGKLQDLGLLEKRIKEAIEKNPGIQFDMRNLFADKTRQKKKDEKVLLSEKDFENAESNLLPWLPEKYTSATLKEFLNKKLAAIRAIIARGQFTDEELHQIRKILKDILYTLKLYRENLKIELGFPFWDAEELKKVKALEEWLGAHNDNHNAIILLSLRRIRAMKRNEKELLLSLRKQLMVERRRLRKLILHSLRTINFGKIV